MKRLVTLWKNTSGVTLSNAGNLFLEAGGGGRAFWVPKANWTGLNGNRVTGEADSAQPNNTVDTIRGGPSLRREHIFYLDLAQLATGGTGRGAEDEWDELFLEWRGYHTANSTGFALDGAAPADLSRTWWTSAGFGWAVGSFVEQNAPQWMKEPPIVCYNTSEAGKNSSPMTGAEAATATEPQVAAGGFQLTVRSFGDPTPYGSADPRQLMPMYTRQVLPFYMGAGSALTRGGMLWGYSAVTSSTDVSRYPKSGDQLGWVLQFGYPRGSYTYYQGGISAGGIINAADLTIRGLSKIWLAVWEIAPVTGASSPYLDFTTASMSIGGELTAVLIAR